MRGNKLRMGPTLWVNKTSTYSNMGTRKGGRGRTINKHCMTNACVIYLMYCIQTKTEYLGTLFMDILFDLATQFFDNNRSINQTIYKEGIRRIITIKLRLYKKAYNVREKATWTSSKTHQMIINWNHTTNSYKGCVEALYLKFGKITERSL